LSATATAPVGQSADYNASLLPRPTAQLSRSFHARRHGAFMVNPVESAGGRWKGMKQAPSRPRRSSFIVRIDRADAGAASGVIERVRTGTKEAFHGVDQIGAVLARMVEAERSEAREALRHPRETESRAAEESPP